MSVLQPIKGEPGRFFVPALGKVINIVEFREDDKYDTVEITATAAPFAPPFTIVAGQQFTFFRDLQSKDLIDTNFTTQRRLPAGEEMLIERIGVSVPLARGNVLPFPRDVKKVSENGYLKFQINRKDVIEGPLVKMPSGYGISGNTVENDQGIVSIGVPATASVANLRKPQFITTEHDVDGVLTFQNRAWLNAAAAPAGASQPTLENAVLVKLWLHGLIKSAATK
jgi:hypothetical protein